MTNKNMGHGERKKRSSSSQKIRYVRTNRPSEKNVRSRPGLARRYRPDGRRKRARKIGKFVVAFAAVFLASVIFFVACYAFSILSKFQHDDLTNDDIGIDKEQFFEGDQAIVNIALLGVDDNGTSDAIIIASIDANRNKIKLTSILRDSLVKVEPNGKKSYYTKLNEAFGNGGAATTLKAINRNFNLNIKEYVSIKFEGLSAIIDMVGGVKLNITKEEAEHINGLIASTQGHKHCPMVEGYGDVTLNGIQAIEYARIRKKANQNGQSDDYGRTDRQRAVLEVLFEKAKNMPYNEILGLVDIFLQHMKTSLDLNKIIELSKILKNDNISVLQNRVPMVEYTIDRDYHYSLNGINKSTVYYNLKYAGQLINAFIYDDILPDEYIERNPPPLEGGPLDSHSGVLENS